MGTDLEVSVAPAGVADAVGEAVLAEVERLTPLLSGHDPTSELSRWRRGESAAGADLHVVLVAAQRLHARTGGAFHPALGGLVRLWREADGTGRLPDADALRRRARDAADLPFAAGGRRGDCSGVDLDGIAKGYVVDRALAAGLAAASVHGAGDAVDVTVNAGGDLRHHGPRGRRVLLEDPHRAADNAPPLTAVTVRDAALATSGTGRRGVRVGGRWLGHVLDPRTGWPVAHTLSASVLAADSMTADALATAALVLPPAAATALVAGLGASCLLLTADGVTHASAAWPSEADDDQHHRQHGTHAGQHERGAPPLPDGQLQRDAGQ